MGAISWLTLNARSNSSSLVMWVVVWREAEPSYGFTMTGEASDLNIFMAPLSVIAAPPAATGMPRFSNLRFMTLLVSIHHAASGAPAGVGKLAKAMRFLPGALAT